MSLEPNFGQSTQVKYPLDIKKIVIVGAVILAIVAAVVALLFGGSPESTAPPQPASSVKPVF